MIRMLSTDFDGTLVNHLEKPAVAPELFPLLEELQGQGVKWAVNTGRELGHILEGLEEFRFPMKPDFVVTTERHVYRPTSDGKGWEDYGEWNQKCALDHAELFATAKPLTDEIVSFVETETAAQIVYEGELSVGFIATSDEETDRIAQFIDLRRVRYPTFHYQRNTVYLRFCHSDYSKGAALGELGRLLGIGREEIMAVGDHHNDIPMLDGRFAAWSACPGNSAEAVKQTVRNAGGYVARGVCSEGVVEALRHYAALPHLGREAMNSSKS